MPENHHVPGGEPTSPDPRPDSAEADSGAAGATGSSGGSGSDAAGTSGATPEESAAERTTQISAADVAALSGGSSESGGGSESSQEQTSAGRDGSAEQSGSGTAEQSGAPGQSGASDQSGTSAQAGTSGQVSSSDGAAETPAASAERTAHLGGDLGSADPGQTSAPQNPAERTEVIPVVPAGTGESSGQDYASPTDFIGAPGFLAGSAAATTAGGTQQFPEHDAERTETIPKIAPQEQPPPAQTAQWSFAGGLGGFQPDPPQPPQQPPKKRSGLLRGGIAAGVVVGALVLVYLGDLLFSSGQVPRGTTVADVEIGGLTKAAAQRKLQDRLGDNLHKPVQLSAGDTTATIDPDEAGLKMDWPETIERAGSQPLNPITRISSLFTEREIPPATAGDREQVAAALQKVKPQLDRAPAEGTIRFEGTTPVAVNPVTGRTVDMEGATDEVISHWAASGPVRLPYTEQPVSTTKEGVQKALHEVAQPAVAAPVTVRGEGHDATLAPEAIANSLRFQPDGKGGLRSSVDVPTVVAAVEPQLRDTIKPGVDAQIVLEGGRPTVRPSVDGHGVDWNRSFERLGEVYKRSGDRSVQAVYAQQPPKFTTDHANGLGIREVISEFETGGFEAASGVNIRRVAEQVNGAIIKPGETFSLNGHTGPRGVPQGYVESGVIEDGRPAKAVGGGISQFATTLYNASYFAGVEDVEHKEHSYYISRYPAGREATVFQNPDGSSVIDVKFKNTLQSGIMITTQWTPSSIKIQFWGTKQYDVTSKTGPRTNPKPPQVKVVPPGQPCSPSHGTGGFTVTDTRTLRDVRTGKVTTEKPSKTVYNPQPIINCPPPGPPPPAPR